MKRFFIIVTGVILILVMLPKESFMTVQAQTNEETPKTEAINVGNQICPVSGEKIDEEMMVTYEYEGKIYNFCCAMCIDEFKKEPEKYIEKIEEEKNQKNIFVVIN